MIDNFAKKEYGLTNAEIADLFTIPLKKIQEKQKRKEGLQWRDWLIEPKNEEL